ncbi:hypothetical protein Purlil1_9255 [Purpureocillium lilacinum]|uniref:Uncharacterized protein n=1 Tax=Purpureocillium lilacinum TaxID=33203 RepID=A0ABR0BQU3_PURLI|nr:hypothetical protein Purlil1_9255 [Purpureocillium lilacinum]
MTGAEAGEVVAMDVAGGSSSVRGGGRRRMEEQTKGGRHPGRAEVGWLVVVAQWAPATRPVRRRTGPTAWSSGPGLGAEDATIGLASCKADGEDANNNDEINMLMAGRGTAAQHSTTLHSTPQHRTAAKHCADDASPIQFVPPDTSSVGLRQAFPPLVPLPAPLLSRLHPFVPEPASHAQRVGGRETHRVPAAAAVVELWGYPSVAPRIQSWSACAEEGPSRTELAMPSIGPTACPSTALSPAAAALNCAAARRCGLPREKPTGNPPPPGAVPDSDHARAHHGLSLRAMTAHLCSASPPAWPRGQLPLSAYQG